MYGNQFHLWEQLVFFAFPTSVRVSGRALPCQEFALPSELLVGSVEHTNHFAARRPSFYFRNLAENETWINCGEDARTKSFRPGRGHWPKP